MYFFIATKNIICFTDNLIQVLFKHAKFFNIFHTLLSKVFGTTMSTVFSFVPSFLTLFRRIWFKWWMIGILRIPRFFITF
ncbi:MAG: hypothetical protein EBS49_06840 [Verrucomicrobia bacterium]|nr:hypothetical protein [Verrucomicrobiota bacterium]